MVLGEAPHVLKGEQLKAPKKVRHLTESADILERFDHLPELASLHRLQTRVEQALNELMQQDHLNQQVRIDEQSLQIIAQGLPPSEDENPLRIRSLLIYDNKCKEEFL